MGSPRSQGINDGAEALDEIRTQDARSGFQALRRFVRPKAAPERCDLCGAPVAPVHQHLLDPATRALVCACRACAILFCGSDSKYRRVPSGVRLLQHFNVPDALWEDLAIPINMAYFYKDSIAGRAKASYPSPAGATESLLSLGAWNELVALHPILESMEPDVEALLANRLDLRSGHGSTEYYLLPIDECFKLVGLIRTHWRGLSGGVEMWQELAQYFAGLRDRAILVGAARA
jgi:hypothetical protein